MDAEADVNSVIQLNGNTDFMGNPYLINLYISR